MVSINILKVKIPAAYSGPNKVIIMVLAKMKPRMATGIEIRIARRT